MNKSPMPSYIKGDTTDAIKLLKRQNITATKEVELFTSLCSFQIEKIPYTAALEQSGMRDKEFTFNSMLKKFEEHQILVLRNSVEMHTLVPSYIRLCDEGSLMFFTEMVTERLNSAMVDPNVVYCTQRNLRANGYDIDQFEKIALENSHFLDAYKNESSLEDEVIEGLYSLPISGNDRFLCSYASLPVLCDLCISRIQFALNTAPELTLALAEISNIPLSDFKQKIVSHNYTEWDSIATSSYNQFEKLKKNPRIMHHDDILDSLIILYSAIKPKIMFLLDSEQQSRSISDFVKVVLQNIGKGFIVDKQHFQTIVNKGANQLQMDSVTKKLAMSELVEQHTVTKTHIPEMLDIKNQDFIFNVVDSYIHSSVLLKIITDQFFELSKKLQDYYTHLLHTYLTKGLTPNDIIFFDDESFEISVRQKTKEYNEIYCQLLRNPILLASLLTKPSHSTASDTSPSSSNKKQERTMKTMSVSRKLALFFNVRTRELLPWQEIFNLSLPPLIESAYKQLKWYNRLVLFFSGRYKQMHSKFALLQKRSRTLNIEGKKKATLKPKSDSQKYFALRHTAGNNSKRKKK